MNILDVESVRGPITGRPRAHLDFLEVFAELESTNNYLLDQPRPAPGRFRVALAEHQTAGRGRLNRSWQSPRSSGLYLSMSYTFAENPGQLPSLTLAIGIGVAQSLQRLGVPGIGLKWPNDIVACGGKVGGILTEVIPGQNKGVTVVVGVGLNVDFRLADGAIDISGAIVAATDLSSCTAELPGKSAISAALIEGLFDTLVRFDANGFVQFYEIWQPLDWLRGKRIVVDAGSEQVSGLARGIDSDGALLVDTGTETRRILSGSVSLIG